jgi:hypothetical protein
MAAGDEPGFVSAGAPPGEMSADFHGITGNH